MKSFKALALALLLLVCTLVFVSCVETVEGKSVTRLYVNDEMHVIAEYNDGTTEDLGYVGVEVEKEVIPPKYTVTFLDANGAVLKTEKVYKGDGATAPEAPEIPDSSFDGWDVDFSVITEDLTVRPTYVAASEYTVTFLDENGGLIKMETVIHGHAATAPAAPLRADTIFVEWDTEFDSVKCDLTVIAIYRQKTVYTVTFKDYSGLVIGTASVKETGTAVAPTTPVREGYTFAGWSSSLSNITSNKTVTAKYTLQSTNKTVIDLSYTLNANGTVTLTATAKGNVKFAGIDGSLTLPAGVTNATVADGDDCMANLDGGKVYFIYGEAYDTTAETVLFRLTFESTAAALTFDLSIDNFVDASDTPISDYIIVGETVTLK